MGDMWDMDNLAAVCKQCNLKKGNKKLSVFLKKESTPPVFSSSLYPKTTSTVQAGPMSGQPKPEL
jgi:5-methylcytosine-specific restriction endonuclease McrA